MIAMTETAAEFIRELTKEENLPEQTPLRLGVTREGCVGSGTEFSYKIGLETSPPDGQDEVFESQGLRIIVDRESLPHLDGLLLDALEQFGGVKFMFRNPQAAHVCRCGNTFSKEQLPT